ncbi:hypothetical protein Gotur_016338, partial [Gossypium turneri]
MCIRWKSPMPTEKALVQARNGMMVQEDLEVDHMVEVVAHDDHHHGEWTMFPSCLWLLLRWLNAASIHLVHVHCYIA